MIFIFPSQMSPEPIAGIAILFPDTATVSAARLGGNTEKTFSSYKLSL
jgi:hypothetical protein